MAADKTNTPPVKRFSIKGFDNMHYQKVEAFVALIDRQYAMAIRAFSVLASKTDIKTDKPFSFDDYPVIKSGAQKIIRDLASGMEAVIRKGSREEWLYACKKNDEFLNSILDISKVPEETLANWQNRNLDALDAFQKRKVNGLDLSGRVWKYVDQFKATMELAIDVGIGEGRSAQQLSRDIRQNLVNPDNLFRRVRDKRGNLQLSKAAKAFSPGQGVYRSSYKNAMRLTRSEINMAYATSDQLRWQKLDFVVGYEIKRSNYEYDCDVCDKLKGRYPKSFNWKKWHPQCRCYAIPILMSQDEFNTDELNELRAAFKGTEYKKFVSENTVTDVPQGFKDWIKDNKQRSENWSSTPYWIKDNFVSGVLSKGLKPGIANTRLKLSKTPVPETLRERIFEAEDRIRKNKSFETAVLFDDEGNIIFEKKGGQRSVEFTKDEAALFKNKIFTHNHPNGWNSPEGSIGRIGNSFSPADVLTSIKNDLKEVRVATPLMRFSMKRPEKGWPLLKDAAFEIARIDFQVTDEFRSRIMNNTLTEKQANITHWHEVWKRFSKELGIEYSKEGARLPRRKN